MPEFHRSFYEAAVQVLPILILVMVVGELRLRGEPKGGLLGLFFSLAIVASMLFAELAAFAALGDSNGSPVDAAAVLLGLSFGCIYLLSQFSIALRNEAIARKSSWVYRWLPVIVAAISVLVVIGGGALIFFGAR